VHGVLQLVADWDDDCQLHSLPPSGRPGGKAPGGSHLPDTAATCPALSANEGSVPWRERCSLARARGASSAGLADDSSRTAKGGGRVKGRKTGAEVVVGCGAGARYFKYASSKHSNAVQNRSMRRLDVWQAHMLHWFKELLGSSVQVQDYCN
jgi:hypothetical protein